MKSTGHSVIAAMLRGLRDLNGLKGLINVCIYIYYNYIYNIRVYMGRVHFLRVG